jgi:crotonobetainyl-CoA:carnitine CoA-transferase CaiB-like acyl-CoA transferase
LPGPYGNWPAVDGVIESLSGLTSTTGEPEPFLENIVGLTIGRIPLTGHAPLKLAQPSIPVSAALHGVIGAIGALLNRRRTREGDKITVGTLETGVSLVEQHISAHALHGTLGKHALNLRKTKDGWAMIRATRWDQFCKSFDVSEDIHQEFASRESREMNQEKLEKIVDEIISKLTSSEVRERLSRHGMDGAALGTIEELINNEHLKAIGNFAPITLDPEVSLTADQRVAMSPMLPFRASDYTAASTQTWTAPPKLGEHTTEILSELGYSNKQIADLQKKQIV